MLGSCDIKAVVELTILLQAVKLASARALPEDGGGGVNLRQAIGDEAEHDRSPSGNFLV
jgi:hypothetical protein